MTTDTSRPVWAIQTWAPPPHPDIRINPPHIPRARRADHSGLIALGLLLAVMGGCFLTGWLLARALGG